MSRRATRGGKAPAWVSETLLVCEDGPHANTWWILADWQARVTAAQRIAEATGTRGPALEYVRAGRTLPHPVYRVDGHVLLYRPALAQARKAVA